MENEHFFLAHWIFVISGITTIVYIVAALCKGKLSRDSLVNVFTTFLSSASILSGINLAVQTLIKNRLINDPANLEDSEITYTIIGGCVVAWIAIWELAKQFKELKK